eukprot:TRINITY_DN889_c0_g2_i12.p1 TRINITY_DN889_c0_g2~~TRINITY_DN889_c0_g2_i12.p1  ORF type:complete len:244 (-),score=14.77 TRINITY_DN889_c0_g2_i12:1948-2679(-)
MAMQRAQQISLLNEETASQLRNLLKEFHDIISLDGRCLGKVNKEFSLPLKDENVTIKGRLEGIAGDIFRRVSSRHDSSFILVDKDDGKKRFVLDARELNKNLLPCASPVSSKDEILSKLQGNRVFSSLDLTSAFHCLPLDAKSQELTSFHIGREQFCYKRLTMGTAVSSQLFSISTTCFWPARIQTSKWQTDISKKMQLPQRQGQISGLESVGTRNRSFNKEVGTQQDPRMLCRVCRTNCGIC